MARVVLEDWLTLARASGVQMLEKFADTIEKYQEGILNYYGYSALRCKSVVSGAFS
jgi:transposase